MSLLIQFRCAGCDAEETMTSTQDDTWLNFEICNICEEEYCYRCMPEHHIKEMK